MKSISDNTVDSKIIQAQKQASKIIQSENKDAECIFCNGKFSEDEQGEIWIKCFSWTLPEQRTQNKSMTFINKLEAEMVFA